MSDQKMFATPVSRREAMKTALKAGAYAAPVVLSATVAGAGVAAATPPLTGTLTGSVLHAITGVPIAGATVAVGILSTTTNQIGVYTLANALAGVQTVTTSAAGYTTRTDPVTIAANTITTFTIRLAPLTGALTGSVLHAITGVPIAGATVAVGALSTITDGTGLYTLANAPAGVQTVITSAAGFTSRTDMVTIAANTITTFTIRLAPLTGALTGKVLDALTGVGIVGATVSVGALSVTTGNFGTYTLTNVPTGAQTVTTSAAGYTTRTDPAIIAANANTFQYGALAPLSAAPNITIVLTWGQNPQDLDAHLSGPDVVNGGRFEAFFNDLSPVPYVALSMDVVTSFGPETDTIRTYTGGVFVPGEYHFWAENYSQEAGYDVAHALATVFQGGTQIAQFSSINATGDPGAVVWYAFNFTLTATATGQIAITPVQQFIDTPPVAPRKLPPKKAKK